MSTDSGTRRFCEATTAGVDDLEPLLRSLPAENRHGEKSEGFALIGIKCHT